MSVRGFIGPAAAILFPYLLFEYLRMESFLDARIIMPKGHFYIVSSTALLATIIAVAVGISGSRLRNIKVIFLSLSFISVAEIFALHGLSTPGFLLQSTHLPGIAAQLSILLAVSWLWLSSLSSDHPFTVFLSRWQIFLVPVWTLLLAFFGTLAMIYPHTIDFIPLDRNPLKWIMIGITIPLTLMAMYRYYQSYQYSRFPLQISIIYSSGWLIVAQVIMVLGEVWRLSWWLYHFLLLASMIVMLTGLMRQYADKKSMVMAMKALFTSDPVERITSSISPSVRALILATESRDTYTAGHNFRVTMYALRLAEELQLKPEQLRALAQGAIIHDVGKINIPDQILNKPGKLTKEERAIIEMHPVKGYEMCRSLGFMKEELEIIRSHHEKWNGTGYPDGLTGEKIPFMAKIVAVADVYDALTSSRSYREAWAHVEVMKFLNEHKGSHFDPQCIEAWSRVCERDPQVYQYPLSVINEQKTLSTLNPPPGPLTGDIKM